MGGVKTKKTHPFYSPKARNKLELFLDGGFGHLLWQSDGHY